MLFVADVVGGLESPRNALLRHHDTASAAHYAIYDSASEDCGPRKLVLLNTAFYRGSGERGRHTLDVGHLLGSTRLCFRRLTGPESAARDGLTWAGQRVENADGAVVGSARVEEARGGRLTLQTSEGAIVEPCRDT